jgi:GTP-binding protein
MQNLAGRKALINHMQHHPHGVSLECTIPTRGLIGLETDMVNLTSGRGVMSHMFKSYEPFSGEITTRLTGTLVSMETGIATAWALNNIQERGRLFVSPQEEVYEGMIVGENPRTEDMPVNPTKTKHLTNMRSQGEGKGIQLEPPLKMSLERALEYIARDEYVEATPKNLRLRKKILNATQRKRAAMSQQSTEVVA